MGNKQRLQDALRGSDPELVRGTPYQVGLAALPQQTELPERAGALPEPLQVIARQYIGARRKSGEALLDMCRWLSEARQIAKHGEWKIFLEATGTSDDTAERLLNIHIQAMQNPQFADFVRTQWIGQSAAALLAAPSTPQQIIDQVLDSPEPPTVADIKSAIKEARQPTPAPALHPDYQHLADVERILKDAAGHGERTGTALYQEAYDQAWQIGDATLYNRAFAMIDQAVDTPPAAPDLAAPTLADLDSALPQALSDAGYYWKSASPPTIAHNDGWRGDAATVDGALEQAYDRENARAKENARRLSPADHATAIGLTTRIRNALITEQVADATEKTRQLLTLLEALSTAA